MSPAFKGVNAMRRQPALLLFAIATLVATASPAWTQPQKVALCHAMSDKPEGVVKELPATAVDGHLRHGDCLIAGGARPGDACDHSSRGPGGFCASRPQICGDTAGPGGTDIPCACGDTVIRNTRLELTSDPAASSVCSGDGLVLASGVQLDMNALSLSGNGTGTGISIREGGQARHGTVRGFDVGIRVGTGAGNATVDDVIMENNAAAGAVIDVRDVLSRVVFDRVIARGNGGDGLHVRSAPGASNLEDAAANLARANYGFILQDSSASLATQIRDNGAHGIHLGEATQAADVAALIESAQVFGNVGTGIMMEQRTSLVPGSDCGVSAGQPGCSGVTVAFNLIHDNGGPGVELRAGFIIPLFVSDGIQHGLGFVGNEVFHNAMPQPGCTSPQSGAQIHVAGPVGLRDGACSTATTQDACLDLNDPRVAENGLNNHCAWDGTSCRVAWDIGGMCSTGLANSIFDYNTTDTENVESVGLRAVGFSYVLANNNVWRSPDTTQNVTTAPGSVVDGSLICTTRGFCLSSALASTVPAAP